MAIAFDAASSQGNGSVASSTHSHTCTGSDRLLLIGVCVETGATVSTATYNGVSCTFLRADAGSGLRSELWYILAPATGANNIVVTLSTSARLSVGAASFTGVDQNTPPTLNGATGSGTSPSVSITTANANSWVVSNCASLGSGQSSAPGASETERWDVVGTGNPPIGRTNTAGDTEVTTTAGSHTMSNTLGVSAAWAITAAEVKEKSGVSSVPTKCYVEGVPVKNYVAGVVRKEID